MNTKWISMQCREKSLMVILIFEIVSITAEWVRWRDGDGVIKKLNKLVIDIQQQQ